MLRLSTVASQLSKFIVRQCENLGLKVIARRSDSEHRAMIAGDRRPTTIRQLRDEAEQWTKGVVARARSSCSSATRLSFEDESKLRGLLRDKIMELQPSSYESPGRRGAGSALLAMAPAAASGADAASDAASESFSVDSDVYVRHGGQRLKFPGKVTAMYDESGAMLERCSSDGSRFGHVKFDIEYDDGDIEKDVPRLRVALAGQAQISLLPINSRVDAFYRDGDDLFPATVVARHPDGTYALAYDDGD